MLCLLGGMRFAQGVKGETLVIYYNNVYTRLLHSYSL